VNPKAIAEALRALAAAVEAPEPVAPAPTVEASALDWRPIKACGLPLRTARLAVREREIGASRVGRDLYVDMRDVRAFVERRRVDRDPGFRDELDVALDKERTLRLVGRSGR